MATKDIVYTHVLATHIAEIAFSNGKCTLHPCESFSISLDTTQPGEVKLGGINIGNRHGAIHAYLNKVMALSPTIVVTEY